MRFLVDKLSLPLAFAGLAIPFVGFSVLGTALVLGAEGVIQLAPYILAAGVTATAFSGQLFLVINDREILLEDLEEGRVEIARLRGRAEMQLKKMQQGIKQSLREILLNQAKKSKLHNELIEDDFKALILSLNPEEFKSFCKDAFVLEGIVTNSLGHSREIVKSLISNEIEEIEDGNLERLTHFKAALKELISCFNKNGEKFLCPITLEIQLETENLAVVREQGHPHYFNSEALFQALSARMFNPVTGSDINPVNIEVPSLQDVIEQRTISAILRNADAIDKILYVDQMMNEERKIFTEALKKVYPSLPEEFKNRLSDDAKKIINDYLSAIPDVDVAEAQEEDSSAIPDADVAKAQGQGLRNRFKRSNSF